MRTRLRFSVALALLGAFALSACGGGGGGSGSTPPPVTPPTTPPPTGTAPTRIALSSDYAVVASGQNATLTWDSDAAACTASSGWTGAKTAAGSFVVGPLTRTTNFDLSCATGNFTALTATVEIQIASPISNNVTSTSGLTSVDFLKLGIALRELVWDPQHSLFHGITRPTSLIAPNSLVSIDPSTLATRVTALGAEPYCIAVSADGTYLYVGFRTNGSIRRFLTNGLVQNLAFNVGTATSVVLQIAVSPQSSRTIAVRASTLGSALENPGVVIVDDAVSRPGSLHGAVTHSALRFPNLFLTDLDWSPDATHILAGLFSYDSSNPDYAPDGLLDLTANAQGVTISRHLPFQTLGQGTWTGDRYFTNSGILFSLNGPVHYLGLMPYFNERFQLYANSPAQGKTFSVSSRLNTGGNTGGMTLESFDTERFTHLDAIAFGPSQMAAGTPVLWGTDGIAIVGTTALAIAHGSFLRAGGIPPAPSMPAPTMDSYTAPGQPVTARIFNIGAKVIAANPCGRVYAATSSSGAPRPNSVLEIDVTGGAVTRTMQVGSGPHVLAASDDCGQLYVGHRNNDGVAKVRLSDMTVTATLPVNVDVANQGYLAIAQSLSVAPAMPDSVAIARGDMKYSQCIDTDHGIEIFDGAARRSVPWDRDFSTSIKGVAWGASANTLYGMNTFGVYAFNVSAGGPNNPALLMTNTLPVQVFDLGNALFYDRVFNRAYTVFGSAFDISGGTQRPQIATGVIGATCGTPGSALTTDTTSGKVFWVSEPITDPVVQIFTGATLVKTGQFEMPRLTGNPRMLVRPSSDSLALLMDDGFVVLMQGPALQP